MRAKRLSARRGVGGTYTLPERREACADDFGGECDTLTQGNSVSWAKTSKGTHT